MQSLYSKGFEHIYDDMYQTFINYLDEFNFYSEILYTHQKNSVLEIGCGTGHLAKHFISSDINYTGLDISQDMINLSKSKNPSGAFIKGDVTGFSLPEPVDAAIITGRTISYMLSNRALTDALKSIHSNLSANGILCFDFIDASRFLKEIKGGKTVIHKANMGHKHYVRESFMKENTTEDNIMFDWNAVYYRMDGKNKIKLATDTSTVRAFTRDEWSIFLHLNDFELIEFIDRKSYAFDTYVVIARKK